MKEKIAKAIRGEIIFKDNIYDMILGISPEELASQLLFLPTDVMIEEKCQEYNAGVYCDECTAQLLKNEKCNKDGTISRPLTVGEVLEKANEWKEALEDIKKLDWKLDFYPYFVNKRVNNALALNGGKIKKDIP